MDWRNSSTHLLTRDSHNARSYDYRRRQNSPRKGGHHGGHRVNPPGVPVAGIGRHPMVDRRACGSLGGPPGGFGRVIPVEFLGGCRAGLGASRLVKSDCRFWSTAPAWRDGGSCGRNGLADRVTNRGTSLWHVQPDWYSSNPTSDTDRCRNPVVWVSPTPGMLV